MYNPQTQENCRKTATMILQNRTLPSATRSFTLSLLLACVLSISNAQAQRREKQNAEIEKFHDATSARCFVSVKNILDQPLPARIRLLPTGGGEIASFEITSGEGEISAPAGSYTAAVYAYDAGVPILVHVQPVVLSPQTRAEVKTTVLEGSGGNRSLSAFDGDLDLALDRVEIEAGTDPANARSAPAETVIEWPSPVLEKKGAWYRGELHAYSAYGPGSEKVGELVRRAESERLDFLAIADPNTLAAAQDPGFKSNKVVLIPAMEWRHPQLGSALLYAPSSLVSAEVSWPEAQALAMKLEAQGGIFAVAHPTQPGHVWQWGLKRFNAIEAWFGAWRSTPPIEVGNLAEEWSRRNNKNEFLHPIAYAAATNFLSANGQATVFYDVETTHGVHAALIGGSGSTGKKQPLGRPMTYVWAKEKSLNAILDGLRRGRTFVNAGPDAPFIEFTADIMADGSTDVGPGGMIPINVKSRFRVGVDGAKGARLEILFNGYPMQSFVIEWDRFLYSLDDKPGATGAYRVRIITAPKEKGYGVSEVLAMTSPIYAQSYFIDESKGMAKDGWIDVKSDWEDPSTVKIFDPSTLDPSQVVTLEPRAP
jgi:hypothetical protein